MSHQNHKLSVTDAQNARHKAILSQLLKRDDNRRCADCHARGPTWASVNLGVFVCLNCSGIHRSLGVHITKVRSTNLDTWLPEQVAFIQAMGNAPAATYWEAHLPADFRRPPEADMTRVRTFISDKYINKAYAAVDVYPDPPCIENFPSHPFFSSSSSSLAQQQQGGGGGSVGGTTTTSALPPPPPPPPQQQQPPPPPPKQFDLLSLDDDLDTTTTITTSSTKSVADWDPFQALTGAAPEPPPHTTTTAASLPNIDEAPQSSVSNHSHTSSSMSNPWDDFSMLSLNKPPPPPPSSSVINKNDDTSSVVTSPTSTSASASTKAAKDEDPFTVLERTRGPSASSSSMAMNRGGTAGGGGARKPSSSNKVGGGEKQQQQQHKATISNEDILALFK